MRRVAISFWLGLICLVTQAESQPIRDASRGHSLKRLDQHKALARRWIEEGFNKRDLDVVAEIFVEGFIVNGVQIGREGLRKSMTRHLTAFPDLHVEITDAVAEGSNVAIWYTVEGTHRGEFDGVPPTGKRVSWTGVDLFRVDGGKIAEARFLSDSLGLLRQLGAVPSAPPVPK